MSRFQSSSGVNTVQPPTVVTAPRPPAPPAAPAPPLPELPDEPPLLPLPALPPLPPLAPPVPAAPLDPPGPAPGLESLEQAVLDSSKPAPTTRAHVRARMGQSSTGKPTKRAVYRAYSDAGKELLAARAAAL